MTSHRMHIVIGCAWVAIHLASPDIASAQARWVDQLGVDTLVQGRETAQLDGADGATADLFVESLASLHLSTNWQFVARPVLSQATNGDWRFAFRLLGARYEGEHMVADRRLATRVELGYINPPVGLATLDFRPSDNPAMRWPALYTQPLPRVSGEPPLQLVAGVYPLGAQATISSGWWDARVAVVDSAIGRPRRMFAAANPPRVATWVTGGGVSPRTGTRVGFSLARGAYRSRSEVGGSAPLPAATLISVEGEFAVGHTRVLAEWMRHAFDNTRTTRAASGWLLQGVRTLSPRWFVTARVSHLTPLEDSTPSTGFVAGAADTRDLHVVEGVLARRLTREVTLRGGITTTRSFGSSQWSRQAGVSCVWLRQWW